MADAGEKLWCYGPCYPGALFYYGRTGPCCGADRANWHRKVAVAIETPIPGVGGRASGLGSGKPARKWLLGCWLRKPG